MNFYEILGVPKNASFTAITIAYKNLLQQYNSVDENLNDEDIQKKLNELNEAYLVLSDEKKRKEYDKNGFVKVAKNEEKVKQTPKSKWQNFWFYYKWYVYGFLFIAIVLIISVRSCVTRVNPDLKILFVASNSLTGEDKKKLEENFAFFTEDITKNNKKEVSLTDITINGELNDPQLNMAMRQKFIAEIAVGDTLLYLCDKESIGEFQNNKVLTPIDDIFAEKAEYDKTLIKITNSKILDGLSNYAPNELYLGIRVVSQEQLSKDKNKKAEYDRIRGIIKKVGEK